MTCPFCNPDSERVFHRDERAYCLWDQYPVSPGHALVIPHTHVKDWFEASDKDRRALVDGINIAKTEITSIHGAQAFNIGINVGEDAGQTIAHLHVHVIPRYRGDVRDPRGGVRHVIPGKGNYLAHAAGAKETAEAYKETSAREIIFGSVERPLIAALARDLELASSIDLAVAFVTAAGLLQLQAYLSDLLTRGGKIRLLTGDYMDVTEPRALRRLLDWREEYPEKVRVRVFQTDREAGFHPKAYIVDQDYAGAVAYIGSSNLTQHALWRGIEWNQRISGHLHDSPMEQIGAEFERLLLHSNTVELSSDWIAAYEGRRSPTLAAQRLAGIDAEVEPQVDAPAPHNVQSEALEALAATRRAGNAAGLVVMATGLGKTWLAAFDSITFKRVLFVAHREEILKQSLETFRKIRPDAHLGLYMAGQRDREADVLFASVQTLSRSDHLSHFPAERFDYVVVDEFHHAAADTYRRLIDHFTPRFLLGLTATPERTDGGDLLALCGENLVFRCDVTDGINRGLLAPFQYFGVPDEIDFANIPWRSGRFDPEALEFVVVTEKRALNTFDQWRKRSQKRTLAFCVSKRHADFMAAFFAKRGVSVAAVHSGPSSAPRTQSLTQLEDGTLQVVFAVDMFNEGVDVPSIDTVMMLRPTESKILWLQQFGRGLRRSAEKQHLTVVDYIGNHRAFLQVPMILLPGAGETSGQLSIALANLEKGELTLPTGCSINYELEALNILKQLAQPTGSGSQVAQWYRNFRELHGRRPTASEAYHVGYDPRNLRTTYRSWLGFVQGEGDLEGTFAEAFERHKDFLEALEITQMTKSYKMLVLLATIAADAFPGDLPVDDLGREVARIGAKRPILQAEFGDALESADKMRELLETNPIAAWTAGRGTGGTSYFSYDSGRFSTFTVEPHLRSAVRSLTQELCDYRMAQYLDRETVAGAKTTDKLKFEESIHSEGTAELWHEYMREEIPTLWGLEFNTGAWNQGFIRADGHMFLLTSLNTQGLAEKHQYVNRFLSPDRFQWMSQNRTKRASAMGRRIANHDQEGIAVHLFVRDARKTPAGRAAPFIYCGDVTFDEWEDDQPNAVTWRLSTPLPEHLCEWFLKQ